MNDSPLIPCPHCRAWLLDGVFNRPEPAPCPSCGTHLQIEVFPALFRKISPGLAAEIIMLEGESSCFFHPQKKAVVPCAGCGRFLCALCDCEFRGEHFCPACLEAGKSRGKIVALDGQRIRYDHIALVVAILPVIFIFPTLITAPIALFIAIRYWNTPRSLVRRNRFRLVLAALLALLQIVGWTAMFISMAARHS